MGSLFRVLVLFTSSIFMQSLCHTLTPSYIGCYVDGGPSNRLFQGMHNDFPGTLTQDICNSHCFEKGFAFAGTQYSYECFCSKVRPPSDKKSTDSECDAKCAGSDSQMCGGNNRLSVFSTGIPEDYKDSIYLGCYIDGGISNRLMQGLQQNFPETLTTNLCIKHCFEKGFAYAGTEYSQECFCSKTKPPEDKKSGETDCNAKCAGDNSMICGGDNRLSVYTTGIHDTSLDGNIESMKYIGCFRDFSNGTRLMNGYRQDFPGSLTNQKCIKLCQNRNFHYAGTQYGKECFCGNNKPSFKRYADDEDCRKRCEGNYLESCGGDFRLSVFEATKLDSTASLDDGKYLGCYKDEENPRALKGHLHNFGNILTPLRCTGLCYTMGFLYSGTQYSTQCFCGDEHPNPHSKVSEDECSMTCSGNPAQKCGGSYRNSIRETGITDIPISDKYFGCFNDFNNQIFKDIKISFEKTNSPRRCMNFCLQLGYHYSGVEYGKECFCGNQEPNPNLVVNGEECNMECSGDSLESCGSNWRLAVYTTSPTTTITPLVVPSTSPSSCQLSETSVRGKKVCRGDIVFEEEFNSPLGNKWQHVIMVAEDYSFGVFHSDPKNCFTNKNRLIIKPSVFEDLYVRTGLLDLKGCTGKPGSRQCGYQAFSYNILPPVASARINTKDYFFFRYGIVEIKAKLPIGDWLVPELWLEPKTDFYGPDYASGRIRIAMSRGNQELQCNGQDMGSDFLESGIVMGPKNDVKSRCITTRLPVNWHDHFHTYTLFWRPDGISFKIDNEKEEELIPKGQKLCDVIGFTNEECLTWSSGTQTAPFDRDFYISLGLSVGNGRDFPDDCINRGKPKPWRNLELKAMVKFWQDKDNWKETWTDDKSALYVEYVRVTAL